MSNKLNYLLGIFTFTILFSVTAAAQTISLKGKIVDQSQAAVSGATVTAQRRTDSTNVRTETNNNGEYEFNNLPAGDYRISVEARGFSGTSQRITLENGGQDLNFELAVGNLTESVTVTATRTQVTTEETAVPVTVLSRERIERQNVNTIGDVFRDLPGASTVNEGAFQVRPRIRGLDSNRILILVDGERLNNARTSTGQSGIEPGLVETEQIESLEIVRGSGSVLYGTDALAGTVNIITKDAPRNLTEGFRLGATFNGYYSSNESGRRGNLALTGSSKFFSFRVAQSLERYGNYFTGDADGLTFPTAAGFSSPREVGNSQSHGSNTNLTTRFFFNENNDLRLNYERRQASNIGSPLLTVASGFNGYFPYSNRDKFSGRYESANITNYLAKVAVSAYYQKQDRNFTNETIVLPFVNSLSETITDTKSYGFDVQTNWLLGNRNFVTAGVSFFRDENEDFRLGLNRLTNVSNTTTSVPNADFGSFAGFVQDEFEVTKRLKLIGGFRVERFFSNSTQTTGFALPATISTSQREDLGITGIDSGLSVSETAATGDLGAVFRVNDFVSLTGRVGRSYRVANLFERFFTGAGSVGGFLVGNPNLKPESGINFDTGVKVRTSKYSGSFTYFNNYYTDFLSSQTAFDRNGVAITLPPTRPGGARIPLFQTVNLGKVRIQGVEADFEYPIKIGLGFLTPNGNISYLRGDNLETNQPLNTITPLKTVAGIRWQNLLNNYYLDWTTRIVNKQERLSTSFLASNGGPEPGFATSDIRGGFNFKREDYRLSFNLGVTNLFNRFYNEQFVFAPARGRSLVFGTTIELNKLFAR
jgi:TonB-dependent heme/hemoglobin receptor